jgi:hypothetical protein
MQNPIYFGAAYLVLRRQKWESAPEAHLLRGASGSHRDHSYFHKALRGKPLGDPHLPGGFDLSQQRERGNRPTLQSRLSAGLALKIQAAPTRACLRGFLTSNAPNWPVGRRDEIADPLLAEWHWDVDAMLVGSHVPMLKDDPAFELEGMAYLHLDMVIPLFLGFSHSTHRRTKHEDAKKCRCHGAAAELQKERMLSEEELSTHNLRFDQIFSCQWGAMVVQVRRQ